MKTTWKSAVIASVLLGAISGGETGCALRQDYLEKQSFLLEASRSGPATASPRYGNVKVRTFRIASYAQGRSLVYRWDTNQYESDFYHEFFVPPQLMLTETIQRWLDQSGVFAHVLEAGSHVEADYEIEGEITRLEGDFRQAQSPAAVLAITVFLLREKEGRTQIGFQQEYYQAIPLLNTQPVSLIAGWNQALGRILTRLETDLAQAQLVD